MEKNHIPAGIRTPGLPARSLLNLLTTAPRSPDHATRLASLVQSVALTTYHAATVMACRSFSRNKQLHFYQCANTCHFRAPSMIIELGRRVTKGPSDQGKHRKY